MTMRSRRAAARSRDVAPLSTDALLPRGRRARGRLGLGAVAGRREPARPVGRRRGEMDAARRRAGRGAAGSDPVPARVERRLHAVSAASQPARRAPAALLDTLVRPLRSIVAIVDFSPKSDNAVARAALLAREHGASLHLLHVVAPRRFATASLWTPERDDLPVRIERACRALATLAARTATTHGVEASCKVRSGDTLQAILEESRAADLVVVAAKRSNPLRDVVLRTPTSGCSGCCSVRCWS